MGREGWVGEEKNEWEGGRGGLGKKNVGRNRWVGKEKRVQRRIGG